MCPALNNAIDWFSALSAHLPQQFPAKRQNGCGQSGFHNPPQNEWQHARRQRDWHGVKNCYALCYGNYLRQPHEAQTKDNSGPNDIGGKGGESITVQP